MVKADVNTPVQYLKGVGPKLASVFLKLGIKEIGDLIYYFPYDYEDRRIITPISEIRTPLDKVFILGEIIKIENKNPRSRMSVIKVFLADKTGKISIVFFNQNFLAGYFRKGMKLFVAGKSEFNSFEGVFQIIPKDWEIYSGKLQAIMPIYGLTDKLYPKTLKKTIKEAIDSHLSQIEDLLPEYITKKYGFPKLEEAILGLHYPKDFEEIKLARERVIFDELFLFQLGLAKEIIKDFNIPFTLTNSQKEVLEDIISDMKRDIPMSRLLQGDVGSGKTIIAALASYFAVKNGYQVAIMAPTEILANQHYNKFLEWFKKDDILLLTGSTQRKKKKEKISSKITIGTHALIEDNITFDNLGLVIIDEQHRFGVLQRSNLSNKGKNPHMLFMTATPIPRSLALTVYGDLDKSTIKELPPGRVAIKTHYVSNEKRRNAYDFMRKKMGDGEQVFIVCPLVEESLDLDMKAAVEESKYLKESVFPEFTVGLIHGKMKSEEKDKIMEAFKDKKINLLVATTVIEVGIDIPNASIMVVEHSERFGLSQLHQLRGRIGRGDKESFCFLMGEPKTKEARTRIKAMVENDNGFKIAEIDLSLRGPGDFLGVRQSGLPEFKMADIIRDEAILDSARREAAIYIEENPDMKGKILNQIKNRFGRFLGY